MRGLDISIGSYSMRTVRLRPLLTFEKNPYRATSVRDSICGVCLVSNTTWCSILRITGILRLLRTYLGNLDQHVMWRLFWSLHADR
jgi:hypothetical protein